MDPDTRLIIISLLSGLLGWSLGSLIDAYLPNVQITKSKKILWAVLVVAICGIFYLKLGRLPQL